MSNPTCLSMTKMSGAGNTFLLLDARSDSDFISLEEIFKLSRPDLAKRLCSPVHGLSADGVLFVQSGYEGFDFVWDFYNSDGSAAEMCGNAARCAAKYVAEKLKFPIPKIKFKTGAGLIQSEILNSGQIQVVMSKIQTINKKIHLKTHTGATETFFFVNTGVPHLVQKIHNLDDRDNLKEMAREVRSHSDIGPGGSNVTFYSSEAEGTIHAVTFERGVENYTLACGTGAVAAARAYYEEFKNENILVKMPGGDLQVNLSEGDIHPRMIGSALFIAEIQFNTEVLNEKF